MPKTLTMIDPRPNGSGGHYERGKTYTLADDIANYFLSIGVARYPTLQQSDVIAGRDPSTGAVSTIGTGSDPLGAPVVAVTGPGGGNRLFAGSREIYHVENPPSAENRLVCVDALPFVAMSENSTYIFGRAIDSKMTLRPKAGGADSESLAVTSLLIEDGVTAITSGVWTTCWAWDDYQLAQVFDITSGKYYLYKSINNFSTVGANAPLYNDNKCVFAVGWNTARMVAAATINIMAAWSLTRATNRRGEDLVVFGQYNVNQSRTPGGANDWSNVLCSRDNGDTWEVVLEQNTAGQNIVRHCHAVQFDPYEKEFWIQYGDVGTSAFFVWDGIHPIAPNTRARDAAQYRGWRGMDMGNNPNGDPYTGQTTVLLFLPDEVIAPIDHGLTYARGVYRLLRDLSVFEKITDPDEIKQPLGHSMFSGTMCQRTGTMIVSTLIESGFTDPNADYTLWIWTATPAGNYRDWKRVGRYMLDTTRNGGRQHTRMLGRPDGTIWIGSSNGAGKEYHSTAVCRIDGIHSGEEEVIHPVYWIDPVKGSDLNNGYSPSAAWATAGYALRSNRVTCSCLVNVEPGLTADGTSSWTLALSANVRRAQTNYPVIVRGKGRKRSGIKGAAASTLFGQGATKIDIRFEALSLYNNGPIWDHSAGAPLTTYAEFRDVYLKTGATAFSLTSGRVFVSQFEADVATRLAFGAGTTDYVFEAESGVVRGGQRLIDHRGSSSTVCRIENVVGIGQTVCGVDVLDTAVTLPTVRNVAIDAAVPVVRDNRTTKTTAVDIVSNNVGRGASTGLIDGDDGSQTVPDLMLIGTTGAPRPGSPLIGAGNANAGPALDINGVAFGQPKNVGAFA